MTLQVLVYFPHNPWPPRTGAHRRCLQMLDAFLQIGARVHLASTKQFSDQPWTEDAVRALQTRGLERVWIYQRSRGKALLERLEAYCGPQQQIFGDYHLCSW